MGDIQTPAFARAIERTIFGALLGMVVSTGIIRFGLLVSDMPTIVLVGLSGIGATIGAILGLYGPAPADALNNRLDTWHAWLKRIGLRAMLGLLGVAALLGVVTVLTGSYDVLGRVSGTVITTAIAAGLLWGSSTLANRPNTQEAGLLGMAATLAVFLLVVPLIWDVGLRGEEVLSLSLVVGLCTPVLMFFLSVKGGSETWYAARIGFALELGAAMTFLVAAWHVTSWRDARPWWETGWWSTLLAFVAFACLCGLKRLTVNWRWLGVLSALFTWTLIMISTWTQSTPSEKLTYLLASITLTFAHASLVKLAPVKNYQHWLSWITIGTAIAAAVFINLEINLQPGGGLSFLGRTGAASLVIVACGSLALIVISSLNRLSAPRTSEQAPSGELATEFGSVTLTCPRCTNNIETPVGRIVCPACQLQMTLHVDSNQVAAIPQQPNSQQPNSPGHATEESA